MRWRRKWQLTPVFLPGESQGWRSLVSCLLSCPTLSDPMDCSLPGSSVHGVFQARTLEWVAIFFSNACMHAKSLQSCPTLCDPMDCSLPGSSVHGIFQARVLEWVAIAFSRAYTLRKPQFEKTHGPQCSLQHYLQQPGHGSNLNVH